MDKIIEVTDLSKRYGSVQAVKDIDFYVEQGTLFAFLGPNGAGKTTTIDILCTLLEPDSGTVAINGYRLGKEDDEIRKSIGLVFQDSLLDPLLTVKENLRIRGGFYGLSGGNLTNAMEKSVAASDVGSFLNRPYGKLSGGQRRRADIARALINTPKILFLDEPTTGLDPQARKKVWETIRNLQSESKMTVFLTTHYMEEAAQADYIIIMGQGEIQAKGTPIELKQEFASDLLRIKPKNKETLAGILEGQNIPYQDEGEVLCIKLESTLDAVAMVQPILDYIDNLEITNGTMDDVFIQVAGRKVKELCL